MVSVDRVLHQVPVQRYSMMKHIIEYRHLMKCSINHHHRVREVLGDIINIISSGMTHVLSTGILDDEPHISSSSTGESIAPRSKALPGQTPPVICHPGQTSPSSNAISGQKPP